MIILGIDPGLTRCGLGVIQTEAARKIRFIDVRVATTAPSALLENRILAIANEIQSAIATQKPTLIALERVFAQSNLPSVMGVAQVSGVVLHLAAQAGIPVSWHTPTQVKAAVTGSGRAAKGQVGFMVAKILNLPEIPKPADAADALAIAITAAWGSGAVEPSSTSQTPAQKKWLAAVAKAEKGKG
ncbi:MAG: crossover junction endodeoxyribonuclease RuvC [Actinomycetota bacterium]